MLGKQHTPVNVIISSSSNLFLVAEYSENHCLCIYWTATLDIIRC